MQGHLPKEAVIYQGRGDFGTGTIHVGQSYRGFTDENEGSEGPCCCVWGARDHEEVGERGVLEVHPVSPPPCSQRTKLPLTDIPYPTGWWGFQEDRGPGQSGEQEEEG